MRIWHKSLIPVLPREQLVAQWRELGAIAGNLNTKGTPNHILVNKVNGRQHYEPIEFFGGINNFIAQQKRDYMKLEYCKNNQIPLFIIKYNENIKERLEEILNELYSQ